MGHSEHNRAPLEVMVAPDHDEPKRSPAQVALASLLIFAVVVATYLPVLDCRALSFDDNEYLTENELVTNPSLSSAGRFLREVLEPSTVHGYYQPLAMISLMLDSAMGATGDDLRPIHRTSLLLHAINSVLVGLVMLSLFRSIPGAIVAGLLFGLHPAGVESVPWLAQRKSLLATLLTLACFLAYFRYARAGGAMRYTLVAMLYLLALMSKPTSTPLPVLLLLLDAWPLNRLDRRAVWEKLPLFALTVAFSVITVISQGRTGGTQMPHEHGPLRIPMILVHNISFYVRHVFYPGDVPAYYIFPEPFTPTNASVIAGTVVTVVLIAGLIVSLRRTRAWVCGFLFLFVGLSPTLGVIGFTDTIASNRFLYLPIVGALLPIAYYSARDWLATARPSRSHTIIAAMTVVICAGGFIGTRRGLAYWKDSVTHFAHLVETAPRAPKARFSYGEALDRDGAWDRAEAEYRAAIDLQPNYARAHNNLAILLDARGQFAEALPHYDNAVRADPNSEKAHNNYGVALIRAGQHNDAIRMLSRAVEINPDYTDARFNLGRVLGAQNRIEEAIEQLRHARRLAPTDPEILYNLGLAFGMTERHEEAIECYRATLAQDPTYPGAEQALKRMQAKADENAGNATP